LGFLFSIFFEIHDEADSCEPSQCLALEHVDVVFVQIKQDLSLHDADCECARHDYRSVCVYINM